MNSNTAFFNPTNETDNGLCCIFMLIVLFCVVVYMSRQTKHHSCCNEMFATDTVQSGTLTLPTCQAACDRDPACKGFLFNPSTGKCTTKTSFSPNTGTLSVGTNTYYVTGLQSAPYTTTTTYTGTAGMTYDSSGTLGTSYNDSSVNCSLACMNVANCVGYVYDTNNATAPCTLHQSWGNNSYITGATAYLSSAAGNPLPRQYTLVPNIAYNTV